MYISNVYEYSRSKNGSKEKTEQVAAAWKGNKEITDSLFPSKGDSHRNPPTVDRCNEIIKMS